MKKQLVIYVSKIKTADDKLFFRFTPNIGSTESVWSEWDTERNEPDRVEKTFASLKGMLVSFDSYPDFRMAFQNEKNLHCSNPYAKSKDKAFVDQQLSISESEEEFWRELMLDLCIEKA